MRSDSGLIGQKCKNYEVIFNVTTENAKVNKEYTGSYTVHQLSGSGEGVPILIKIAKNFKLKVVKDPNKFYIDDYYKYIPRIIITLIIILFLFKKDWIKNKIFKNMSKKRKIIKWKH